MKIGLLAYHSAINFGANLQLLSTFCYFSKQGIDTIIINWVPKDLEESYASNPIQVDVNRDFRRRYWKESAICRTSQDVAKIIEEEQITAIVIGSDAVAQHHPLLERLRLSKRKLINISHPTSDRMFPNPFWGDFNQYLKHKRPIAVISASSQDSAFHLFSPFTKKRMFLCIKDYQYLSVRDSWTQKMFSYISNGRIVPHVTPDPVFGFNENASHIITDREELMRKFSIKGDYILYSFRKPSCISQAWLNSLETLCHLHKIQLVRLPFSDEDSFGDTKSYISYPLSPLDWYCLIKYSSGYIGNNMHPIIVSLHNCIPFFSFDNYGRKYFSGLFSSDGSSKIKHIVSKSGLSENRVSCIGRYFTPPTPESVLTSLLHFDYDKSLAFSQRWNSEYGRMMTDVMEILRKNDSK